MIQGQVFLKEGGLALGTFSIWFFQGSLFLHLEITSFAKLCYALEETLLFSATIILWKNVIITCLKMNLKISHKLR